MNGIEYGAVGADTLSIPGAAWVDKGMMMARRLVTRVEHGNRVAQVYRDTEWDEFVVEFWVDGERREQADYHTDDRDDAISTAQYWICH